MTSLPADDDIKAAEVKIFINQKWASLFHRAEGAESAATSDAARKNQRFIIRVSEVLQRFDDDLITRPLDSQLIDVSNNSRWVSIAEIFVTYFCANFRKGKFYERPSFF